MPRAARVGFETANHLQGVVGELLPQLVHRAIGDQVQGSVSQLAADGLTPLKLFSELAEITFRSEALFLNKVLDPDLRDLLTLGPEAVSCQIRLIGHC